MKQLAVIQSDRRCRGTMIFPQVPNGYACEITIKGHKGSCVFSRNKNGLEHISFSRYDHKIPNWEEMVELKDMFFEPEEEVVQIFPKKSEYVNIMGNCMHLWRNPKYDHQIEREVKNEK